MWSVILPDCVLAPVVLSTRDVTVASSVVSFTVADMLVAVRPGDDAFVMAE